MSTEQAIRPIPAADTPIGRQFAEQGFYLAKGVFSPSEVEVLDQEFDRIVDQLLASGEEINARWGGAQMDKMGTEKLVVLHTHNVQQYSAAWTRALLGDGFTGVARDILGPDVVL